MAFLKRLGFYLIGLSIGLVFLALFFKKKSEETGVYFCYFPNCRTLKDMRSKTLTYSEHVAELIAQHSVDTVALKQLFTDGEIDFSKSDTHTSPCKLYVIEGEIGLKIAVLDVESCEASVTVLDIRYPTVQN